MTDQKKIISSMQLLFILLLLTLGFRTVQLKADPPPDLDWSGGYFADEGYWSHNARNAVLFGNAKQDEWDGRPVSPIFCFVQQAVFLAFGPGLIQVRIIGLLSAAIIAACTFYFFRFRYDPVSAFIIALFISLNFPMLVLARQGILDPFATALAAASLFLLCVSSPLAFIASGVLLIASITTKYFMIYFTIPVIAALFLIQTDGIPARRKFLFFSTGAVAAGLVWLFANYIPNRDILDGYNNFYSSQQAQQSWQIVALIKNVGMQPFYLYMVKTPAVLFFGNLMLWYTIIAFKKSDGVVKVIWIWLITGILFFALWRYRPLRYYTSMIPPLAALAAIALLQCGNIAAAFEKRSSRLLLTLGAAIPFAQITFVLIDRAAGWGYIPEQLGIRTIDAIVFLALSIAGVIFLIQGKCKWIPVAFIAGFLFSDVRNYVAWMMDPDYAAVEIAEDLESSLPKDAVLSGQWSPELVLENQLRVVPVWKGFVNSEDPFERYHITHLLLWRYPLGDEYGKFSEWYPDQLNKFVPIKKYRIKDSELLLLENRQAMEKKP